MRFPRSARSALALLLALASAAAGLASCSDDDATEETGPGLPPDACGELPAFEAGDPAGHPDPFGAKAAGQARAGVLSDPGTVAQPAHGRQAVEAGDFVLANSRIAVVVEKPGLSDGYARFGGEVVAIDRIGEDGRPSGESKYLETLLGLAIEMIEPESVTVLRDGSDGGEATVRVKGALKAIPFLGDGPFAAFFPVPYALDAVLDYVLAPDSDKVLLRFGVNNTRPEAIDFGVLRDDSDELYGFFHTSQSQIVTPARGFAKPTSETPWVGFDGGDFGFAFREIGGSLRFALSQSGLNLFYGQGFTVDACAQALVDHVEIVGGGPGYDGLREAIRRSGGEAPWRSVEGIVKDAGGAPVAGAWVHELDEDGAYLSRARSGEDGRFTIHAPGERVTLVAQKRGYPPHAGLAVEAGEASAALAFSPHARLAVRATDAETGQPLPVRVQVIPKAALPPTPDAFGDPDEAEGRLHQEFAVTGEADLVVPPGEHRIIVSRGFEWEPHDVTITASPGEPALVEASLTRGVNSTAYMCADFHVHSFYSMDSSDPVELKVKSAIADGLEIPVSSEHEWIADFQPVIEELGLADWAFGVPSLELTTFTYGHFGIVPLLPAPGTPNRGAIEWVGRPVGDVFADAHGRPERPLVIVNHPRITGFAAYFNATSFDPARGEGSGELWSPDFDLVEVFNDSDFEENRKETVRDWFSLLRAGRNVFAVGSSDSHRIRTQPVGYPRTCIHFGHDDPGALSHAEVRDAMSSGHATVSGGLFMTATGPGGESPGETVPAAGDALTFTVTVEAPSFVSATTLESIVDGETVKVEDLLPMGEGPSQRFVNAVTLPIPKDGKRHFVVFHAKGEGDLAPLHPGKRPFAVSNPIFVQGS